MPSARPRSSITSGGNVRSGFEGIVDPASRRALFDLKRQIEDLGGQLEATNLRTTPTAWTRLTLGAGWTHDATSPASVRKVGDKVELRGRIAGTSASPLTMPVGYRPAIDLAIATGYVVSGAWTVGNIYFTAAGGVTILMGLAGLQGASLSNISYSVTA